MSREAELIKQNIRLADFVTRYVRLKAKGGGEYLGLCPFHSEKTPSFTVSDTKGFYYCFGCGAKGDLFNFYMQMEKAPYIDALKYLAEVAGVELKDFNENKETYDQHNKFLQLYEKQKQYYHNTLFGSQGSSALQYLKERGLDEEFIRLYGIGYCPSYESSSALFLQKKLANSNDLVESGLFKKSERTDKLYDPFAGRIIFPIQNKSGKVIAFGGRILPEQYATDIVINSKKAPKYLNSADTLIFHKGHNLYGLDIALPAIRKEEAVIVVEGYMDVIKLYSRGIRNVIAPLGTGFKAEQLDILYSASDKIIFCLDGDDAGLRAMDRIASLVISHLKPNKYVQFCTLPKGCDPDDYVSKYGQERLLKLLSSSESLSRYIFAREYDKYDLQIPEGRVALKKSLNDIAQNIGDEVIRREYVREFNDLCWQAGGRSSNKYGHGNKQKNHLSFSHLQIRINDETSEELDILALLLIYPDLLERDDIYELFLDIEFEDKTLDKIKQNLIECYNSTSFISELEKDITGEQAPTYIFDEKLLRKMREIRNTALNRTAMEHKILRRYNLKKIEEKIAYLKEKYLTTGSQDDYVKLNNCILMRNRLKRDGLLDSS